MKGVAICTFLCLFLHLSVALGDCNNTMIASLIQNQMTLLEQVTNMVDSVSKFICPSKKQIAFHAETGSSKTYQKGSLWVYDKVITNVGNAYNPSTGKFTAPTKGIYQFNWYTLSNPKEMSHAGLFVNGVIKARQASNNNGGTNQYITAGSSMALLLNEGDEVYIMDVYGYTVSLGSQWTAFGGVLIN